jgi:hypothetical protein
MRDGSPKISGLGRGAKHIGFLMIKSTAQVAGILISMKRLKTGTQAQ